MRASEQERCGRCGADPFAAGEPYTIWMWTPAAPGLEEHPLRLCAPCRNGFASDEAPRRVPAARPLRVNGAADLAPAFATAPEPPDSAGTVWRTSRGVLAAIGALVAIRLVHWLAAPPNSDEAYYWLWGLRPALSYFDHPPLLAWIQGLFHAALGRSLLVLRLPAALCTAGTVIVLGRIAARLAGPGAGRTAAVAATLLASPLLLMLTSFAWHDALVVFLAGLAASLLVGFLAEVARGERGRTSRLFLGAAVLGLAGLAKYNAVFVGVGVALAIVSDRRLRRLLREPRTWAAAALTLAVLSPVLAWNLEHGLASFRFHLVDRHGIASGLELRPLGPVHFLVPTVLLLSPTLIAAIGMALGRRAAAQEPYAEVYRRTALGVFASSTAVFLGLSLVSWSQYYWNVVAYVLLVPPAALALSARPRWMSAHLAYGLAAAAALVVHAAVLPLTAFFPAIQDDDSKEPMGWAGIAEAVSRELRGSPGSFAATTDYRSGAHLAWALGSGEVVVLSGRRSQFDYWLDPRRVGEDAILVTDDRAPLTAEVLERFDQVRHLASLPVERLGVRLKTYELWRCQRFRGNPAASGS